MNEARDSSFYMANLGAEAKRALRFYEKGMHEEYKGARDRAGDIIRSYLEVATTEGGKEEALLLNDLIFHIDEGSQAMTQKSLDTYFMPFAMRVALDQR